MSFDKAVRTLKRYDGIVEQATENEIADAAARADRTGMFNCPHTGVALAALEKLLARGEVRRTDRVIVISTANGLKFTEFKVAYHTRSLAGVTPRYPNPPVELPNSYDAVRRAIDELAAPVERACDGKADGERRAASGSRSVEVRRRVAGRRARDPARRRPHRAASRARSSSSRPRWRASPTCCSRAPRMPPPARPNEATRIAAALLRRHREIARELLPAGRPGERCTRPIDASAREYRELCGAIAVLGHIPPRASDILVSRGERMSAALLAAVLSKQRTPGAVRGRRQRSSPPTAQHGGAAPNLPETGRRARRALRPLLAAGTTPVVPGFIGQAPDGSPTTLGRGGSDLTATLLAGPLRRAQGRALEGRARASSPRIRASCRTRG